MHLRKWIHMNSVRKRLYGISWFSDKSLSAPSVCSSTSKATPRSTAPGMSRGYVVDATERKKVLGTSDTCVHLGKNLFVVSARVTMQQGCVQRRGASTFRSRPGGPAED